MRVDFVFPKFKQLSGAERLILSLGRALVARGHQVRLVCHQFHPSCRPLAEGLTIDESGKSLERSGNHYLDSALGYLRAFALQKRISPDADVVCLFGPALVLAWRRSGHAPLVYFCYEPPRAAGIDTADVLERVGPWRWVLKPLLQGWRLVDQWLVGRVDAVLVNGRFGQERVAVEYGRTSSPITHGVNIQAAGTREEARERLGLAPGSRIALTVNFLHPRKRVDLLIGAWAEVERRLPQAELLIVGDGPERVPLFDLATRLGLRNVRFRGFVAEDELGTYYRASDLLVHVAREETFGLTVLEAAAFGLPVVAVDEGGPRYTVRQRESGLLVPASQRPISDAIVSLLADLEQARVMGARGREIAAAFSWEKGAEDFLVVCETLGIRSTGLI